MCWCFGVNFCFMKTSWHYVEKQIKAEDHLQLKGQMLMASFIKASVTWSGWEASHYGYENRASFWWHRWLRNSVSGADLLRAKRHLVGHCLHHHICTWDLGLHSWHHEITGSYRRPLHTGQSQTAAKPRRCPGRCPIPLRSWIEVVLWVGLTSSWCQMNHPNT